MPGWCRDSRERDSTSKPDVSEYVRQRQTRCTAVAGAQILGKSGFSHRFRKPESRKGGRSLPIRNSAFAENIPPRSTLLYVERYIPAFAGKAAYSAENARKHLVIHVYFRAAYSAADETAIQSRICFQSHHRGGSLVLIHNAHLMSHKETRSVGMTATTGAVALSCVNDPRRDRD